MPEYLAPGVYVEEVSFRSKSIEGVSTTTTGFIGPARYGPIDQVSDIITSLGDFEETYGDRQQLAFSDEPALMHNYLWHAVRAFFEEGGKRLYCMRVFNSIDANNPNSGYAFVDLTLPTSNTHFHVRARFPGASGSGMRVRFTLRMGPNVLSGNPIPGQPGKFTPKVHSLFPSDVVWVARVSGSTASPVETGAFYSADQYFDPQSQGLTWQFNPPTTSPASSQETVQQLADLTFNPDPKQSDVVRVVTLTITVTSSGRDSISKVWDGIPLDSNHEFNGYPDGLAKRFGQYLPDQTLARTLPIVILTYTTLPDGTNEPLDGLQVLQTLFNATPGLQGALEDFASLDPAVRKNSTDLARSYDVLLDGGDDGNRPGANEYEGAFDEETNIKTGLVAFEDLDDISIVAAPGSTFGYEGAFRDDASTIMNLLISHAERMRYRIAVLDSGDGQGVAQVRLMRGRIDSSYAAFYYPWIRILDPVTRTEIMQPPSGFVAGIYARNDINRAVYKAPANEVVNLAIGFETLLNKGQQEVLNPEGVNCFRFFEGRGFRLWGARTASSDPEWKYVNLRRYFAYLEHSIDKGTQWAVFEPNGEILWANVRRTIEDFLLNEWQSGALLGEKPEKAYFVRCDRSTMTQNDLDNGRLVCLIGVAPLRPAEFVIFRIGQWTADRPA